MTSIRKPVLAGLLLAVAAAAPAAAHQPSVVADGLANPRGMEFGPDHRLYVAESGRGGDGACIAGPEGGEQCVGATGAITRVNVWNGSKKTIVGGLPSLAAQDGEMPGADATGPNDVSFRGHTAYFTVGLGADPALRAQLGPDGGKFASLYKIGHKGAYKLADLGDYEATNDPDGEGADSNPYSVDAHGHKVLVTDAGGNDLLAVNPWGRIRVNALFPPGGPVPAPPGIPGLPEGTPIPYQAVPTGVSRAWWDGPAYVGQLTGFPFPTGAANVFKVPAGGGTPAVKASGFSVIVDVAAGRKGSLWVLQIASGTIAGPPTPGKLIKVARDGTRTEYAAGLLQQPTGMAVSPWGDAVYVANKGGSPDDAEILKVPLR